MDGNDLIDQGSLTAWRASGVSLSEGLGRRLTALILSDNLPLGTKLPSVRGLARRCDISPDTVVRVYRRLVHAGLVDAVRGSGFYVSERAPVAAVGEPPTMAADYIVDKNDWELLLRVDRPLDHLPSTSMIQSGQNPAEFARQALRSALRTRPDLIATYSESAGYFPLRSQIQRKLASEGIVCDTDAILTGAGATGIMNVIVRALMRPGMYALVEDPGPFIHTMLLMSQGAMIAKAPREPDGPNIEAMRLICETHRPKIFFCSSILQNPTGGAISAYKAHQILLLAREFDFFIVDDASYADIRPIRDDYLWTPLATLDGLSRVIHVGSFSRVLSPALGIGYLAAGPIPMRWLKPFRAIHSLGLNMLAERAVYLLLEDGQFHRRCRILSAHIASSRKTLIAALARSPFAVLEQGRGLYIWLSLGVDVSTDGIARRLMEEGLVLARPGLFSSSPGYASFTRLNVTTTTPRTIDALLDAASRWHQVET